MIDFKDMSFKEIISSLKEHGIFDDKGNIIKKVKKERTHSYKKFVENSGLSTNEAFALLEYSSENDNPELSQKILKASKI